MKHSTTQLPNPSVNKTNIRLILALILSIFLGEILIMLLLDYLTLNNLPYASLIDASMLLIIVFPSVYFAVVVPMNNNLKLHWQSEVFNQVILDSMTQQIVVLDHNGVVIKVNKPWEEFAIESSIDFGKLPQHAKVGDDLVNFCDHCSTLSLKTTNTIRQGIYTVLFGYAPSISLEYECHYKNQIHWYSMKINSFDLNGSGVVITLSDITERKLAESDVRIAAVVFDSQKGIIILDFNHQILRVNSAFTKITGYSADEVLGKNPQELSLGLEDAEFYPTMWESVSEKGSWEGELLGKHKNGSQFPGRLTLNVVKDSQGQLTHYIAILSDISETKLLRDQLAQAQRLEAIGQVASGVAHEINTPIQYIGDNLDSLSNNFADIIAYQQALKNAVDDSMASMLADLDSDFDLTYILADSPIAISQAQEGVKRVSEIIKAMKSFAYVEPSQNMQTINLHDALNNALIITRNSYKYIAEVETIFAPEVSLIDCYASELNQVFLNLIINAAHAIEEKNSDKGLIRVSTRLAGKWIEILIQDNGVGIPLAIQDKVFNLFFTTKPMGKGTGQGLSLAHNIIVNKHHGQFFFESTEGMGTTFHILLPN